MQPYAPPPHLHPLPHPLAHHDVLIHARIEEDTTQRNARDVRPQPRLVDIPDILIVQLDRPQGFVEPSSELRDGGLSRAGVAYNEARFVRGEVEGDVGEDGDGGAGGVGKGDVVQGELAVAFKRHDFADDVRCLAESCVSGCSFRVCGMGR